jgi:hypothetical protein
MANSYLNRTPSGDGNKRTFTFSTWLKISTIKEHMFFTCGVYSSTSLMQFYLNANGTLTMSQETSGGSIQSTLTTTQVFRDTSAWYHLVIAIDTTQGTASNRLKLYVNGTQVTSFSTETYPSQNTDFACNTSGVINTIGNRSGGNFYFDGYMSHVALVDGQALAPTVFGQTDSTSGIWKFKAPSGVTWGTNGFHLKFENSGNLGLDSSGNSNTLAVNGNGRQALDTPSNVYATLNPLSSSATLTTGNTTGATADSTWRPASTTIGMLGTTGKYYAEFKVISGNNNYVGVYNLNTNFGTSQSTADANRIAYSTYDGEIMRTLTGESTIAGLATSGSSDVVGIAINKNDGEVKFYKNGTLIQTVSHSNITNYDLMIGCQLGYTSSSCFNFGNGYFGTTAISSAGSNGNGSLFEYDVPSGYYALNTKNINTYG